MTPATRGWIVQRVLVEGCSQASVAAVCGISERQVARLVSRYRRYGMASLRDEGQAKFAPLQWLRRLRAAFLRLLSAPLPAEEPPTPLVLHWRRDEDGNSRRRTS